VVQAIARQVLQQLRQNSAALPASPTAADTATPAETPAAAAGEAEPRLVTLETLDRFGDGGEIRLAARAVVTPAARDEARRRGIQLVACETKPQAGESSPPAACSDDVLQRQLDRRGVVLPAETELVWTDQPAREVFRHCSAGQPAVMVTDFADVDRFAAELSPRVWVLDRQRLNLTAAANVAARIARCSSGPGGNDA
jgi:hypothetical protein